MVQKGVTQVLIYEVEKVRPRGSCGISKGWLDRNNLSPDLPRYDRNDFKQLKIIKIDLQFTISETNRQKARNDWAR